jgi:hypothetical protein
MNMPGCVVVSTAVVALLPDQVTPEDFVGYGAFGLVMAIVLGLFRLVEKLIDRKNGNDLAKAAHDLKTALTLIQERQQQAHDRMGGVVEEFRETLRRIEQKNGA